MLDSLGLIKSTSIPFPYWFMAPSKYIFHACSSISKISSSRKSSLPSSPFGFSAQKSDTILPLMVFLATYFKSNSSSRINHLDSFPLKAGFSNKYFNGSNLATTHIWKGRIMCLNFCTAHTRAKHNFSMGVYLIS